VNDDPPTLAHKAAWGLLIAVVIGLVGYSFWKKAHPPTPDLSGKGPYDTKPWPTTQAGMVSGPELEDFNVWRQIKSFSLVDQHCKKVEAKDLRGEVWVASFFFTRCAGICPLVIQKMSDLDKELADLRSVKLVSFSMDPEHDTPEVLTKYAMLHDAVSPRWLFLTGDRDEIYRMTSKEFLLNVDEKNGTSAEPILHSQLLVLVDAQGYVRGWVDPLDDSKPNVKRMAAAVRKLRTMPPAKIETSDVKSKG